MNRKIADLRREYTLRGLSRADLLPDPIRQFSLWFDQAVEVESRDPSAMALATAALDGRPSVRFVLLKDLDPRGFSFFTNLESRKGEELAANPRAALVFYWPELERQVRVEGRVERIADAEADDYFRARPRGSQLGAWASPQSCPIDGRETLDERLRALEERFCDAEVPRPPFWGGFRVVPDSIEFWQGRPNRLHDRFLYTRAAGGEGPAWRIARLAP